MENEKRRRGSWPTTSRSVAFEAVLHLFSPPQMSVIRGVYLMLSQLQRGVPQETLKVRGASVIGGLHSEKKNS